MNQSKKAVLLIDSATSGIAGAYIDRIYQGIENNAAVEVGVSHYFPFNYGKRIFYKYSELTAQTIYNLGWARLYVRFAELLVSVARLLIYVQMARISVVCYALSSNLWLEYCFLWAIKRTSRAKVYVICHDVVPFVSPGEDYNDKIRKRRKFYSLADRLIVHNENSVKDLVSVFGVAAEKIARVPFPIYDLTGMGLREVDVLGPSSNKRFLFIGHLRAEKGIDVLLEAWRKFTEERSDVELIVAGNIPSGCHYDFAALSDRKVRAMGRYLSDDEYFNLIRESDCVVLPYLRGTNSAVVSTVLSFRKNLIVSDIEMFRNNPLIPSQSFFRCSNIESLVERLIYFRDLGNDAQLLLDADTDRRFRTYESLFNRQVNEVFLAAVGERTSNTAREKP